MEKGEKKNIVFVVNSFIQDKKIFFFLSICLSMSGHKVALHKFTSLDQFTYQETPTVILLVHTDTAKHKNTKTRDTHTGTPAPEEMLRADGHHG